MIIAMDDLRPLKHHTYEDVDDEALAREAQQHLLRIPTKQLVGQLLVELRTLKPSWWSPAALRSWWPAPTRLLWLAQRPDMRQRITTDLTGLAPRAARKKPPYFQAELIDAVINEGDVSITRFEESFDPYTLVTYGPVTAFWRRFRAQLPLDQDAPNLRRLMGWLLSTLVSENGCFENNKRKPILSAYDLRSAIDSETWHRHVPLEVRVAIDEARLRQEKLRPSRPFAARHDLRIATPEILVDSLPLAAFEPVLDKAEQAMGLDSDSSQTSLPLTTPRISMQVPSVKDAVNEDGFPKVVAIAN